MWNPFKKKVHYIPYVGKAIYDAKPGQHGKTEVMYIWAQRIDGSDREAELVLTRTHMNADCYELKPFTTLKDTV